MKLHEYASLNLYSLIAYLFILFFIYSNNFDYIHFFEKQIYISLDIIVGIYMILSFISILLILFFLIEKNLLKNKIKPFSINPKNKFVKKSYFCLFYIGFVLVTLNIIIFCYANCVLFCLTYPIIN